MNSLHFLFHNLAIGLKFCIFFPHLLIFILLLQLPMIIFADFRLPHLSLFFVLLQEKSMLFVDIASFNILLLFFD